MKLTMEEIEECLEVENTITGMNRWSYDVDVVFEYPKNSSEFWVSTLQRGSTEYQENDYKDILECFRVYKKEVLVEKWVRTNE